MREQINSLGATHFFGKISQIEKEICIEFVCTWPTIFDAIEIVWLH